MPAGARAKAKAAGEIWYFTGKPCKRGHLAKRQTSNGACSTCGAENTAKYYADAIKKQKMLATARAWKANNPDKVKEYSKKMWSNPEYRKRCSEYLERNRERYRSYYWVANLSPERLNAKREKQRLSPTRNTQATNRRARVRGAEGNHTYKDIQRLLQLQRNKCAWCKISLKNGYHVDHIMPLSKGGSNWPKNLQCLCETCNVRKSAKHPIDWARQNGRLL